MKSEKPGMAAGLRDETSIRVNDHRYLTASLQATSSTNNDQLDWALAYAKNGTPVFPCKWWLGLGSKAPLVPPPGFHLASTDPAQIAGWWLSGPKRSSAHQYRRPAV